MKPITIKATTKNTASAFFEAGTKQAVIETDAKFQGFLALSCAYVANYNNFGQAAYDENYQATIAAYLETELGWHKKTSLGRAKSVAMVAKKMMQDWPTIVIEAGNETKAQAALKLFQAEFDRLHIASMQAMKRFSGEAPAMNKTGKNKKRVANKPIATQVTDTVATMATHSPEQARSLVVDLFKGQIETVSDAELKSLSAMLKSETDKRAKVKAKAAKAAKAKAAKAKAAKAKAAKAKATEAKAAMAIEAKARAEKEKWAAIAKMKATKIAPKKAA